MNLSNGGVTMSTASSSAAWKAGDAVPDQFPAGLRVLVVDDDPTCLVILEKMLMTCRYEVTKCSRAEKALSLLRGNKNGFDIVISDVHMPDMDGFKLLEYIGLEMDLPVIMMSADDSKSVVMKGVTHGACDYLIKPVSIEALKNIWQHVVRKKKNERKDVEQSGSVEEGDRQTKPSEDADYSSSANEGNWKNSKRRKDDEEEETEERDDSSTLKKPRVVWSVELHQQFVAAVNQLGIDKAVPKKILEMMNVPGLTRENVASHLQKYRLYLKRISGVSQHQNNLNNSFMGTQEATFGSMASLNGLDLQSLAATGQLPAQSLATLQAAGLGRPTLKSGMPLPLIDQRNLFSFENPKLRFGEGQQQQQQQQHMNYRPVNLLHGIPTTMEPRQLAGMHHTSQSIGNVNMQVNAHGSQNNSLLIQMAQQQPRGQILNESTGNHVPRLPSSMRQPTVSNGIASGVLGRNGIADNGRGAGFNTVMHNYSSMLNLPLDCTSEIPNKSFPLGCIDGIPNLTSKGGFSEDVDSEIKGSSGFLASYDTFNDQNQHNRSNQWDLQNVTLSFDASQHSNSAKGSLDIPSSFLVNQGFSSSQRSLQNSNQNQSNVGKTMFHMGNGDHGIAQNANQHLDSLLIGSSIRVKTETVPDSNSQTSFFREQFGQEDLMSEILKQQGNILPTDNEFDFDGYSLDNIHV